MRDSPTPTTSRRGGRAHGSHPQPSCEAASPQALDRAALRERDGDDPAARAARGRDGARRRLPDHPRRADARRQRADERRDLRQHLDGAAGREAHGRVLRQEHDRQGRVPADRRDRDALRQHPRQPLARAGRRRGHGLLDHRLERSGDARRAGAQAPLAEATRRGGQADRQAEPGHGRQRPGLLGEVRELLGRRDAPRPDGGRPLHPLRRRGGEALRREHDRRRRHPRLHVRRLLRAGRGDLRRPRRLRARDGHRRPRPRRRGIGSDDRAVSRPRARLGLPPSPRGLDQHLGPQVRTGLSRVSAGSSGATPMRCRRN